MALSDIFTYEASSVLSGSHFKMEDTKLQRTLIIHLHLHAEYGCGKPEIAQLDLHFSSRNLGCFRFLSFIFPFHSNVQTKLNSWVTTRYCFVRKKTKTKTKIHPLIEKQFIMEKL